MGAQENHLECHPSQPQDEFTTKLPLTQSANCDSVGSPTTLAWCCFKREAKANHTHPKHSLLESEETPTFLWYTHTLPPCRRTGQTLTVSHVMVVTFCLKHDLAASIWLAKQENWAIQETCLREWWPHAVGDALCSWAFFPNSSCKNKVLLKP